MDIKELDPNKTVVVATGNAHKVTEIEAILAPEMPGVRFVALGELGDYPDPVEDGESAGGDRPSHGRGRRLRPLRGRAGRRPGHLLRSLGR